MSAIKKLFGGGKKAAPQKKTDQAQVNAETRDKNRAASMGRGELLLGNQGILSSSSSAADTSSRGRLLGN